MREYIDLYMQDGRPTGERILRGAPVPEGRMRLGVRVWLRNRKGEYAISQRKAGRRSHPLFWEATGGGVSAGETPRLAAVREVREELGISVPAARLRLIKKEMCFDGVEQLYVYFASCDALLIKSRLQKEEVRDAKWATIEEIRRIERDGRFYGDPRETELIEGIIRGRK